MGKTNCVIAKDGNYTIQSDSCCKLPFQFIRIEGTQDFRLMHKKTKVGVHPWYGARAHVMREALLILIKDEVITEAQAGVVIERINLAVMRCSGN